MEKLKSFFKNAYQIGSLGFILVAGVVAIGISSFQANNQVYKKPQQSKAAEIGNTYYVSLSGSDSNPGTDASPFKSFSKSVSILKPRDSLLVKDGIYNEILKVPSTINGTVDSPITIKSAPGQKAIIDLQNANQNGVFILGNYINISDFEVRNINSMCVRLDGSNINAARFIVHNCTDQGVQVQGRYVSFTDSEIYLASMSNQARAIGGGWPSGFKVRTGEYVTVERNKIYNNYGEGMGLRGKHITVKNNIVYDNYSINIYPDNSTDVLVENNFAYCTNNQEFFRDGHCAINLALSEEFYDGWDSNLSDIKIYNNILAFGYRNLVYNGFEAGNTNPGLKGAKIFNNTLWGSVERDIVFQDVSGSHDIFLYNNIVQQDQGKLADLKSAIGITKDYNFWVGNPSTLINASGPHDLRGDVKLQTIPTYDDPLSFSLSGSSPAINSGINLVDFTTDYSGNTRGVPYDMGAFEYGSSVSNTTPVPTTLTPSSTPVPTATKTPSPTKTPTPTPTTGTVYPTSTPIPTGIITSGLYPKLEAIVTGSVQTDGTTSVSTNTVVSGGLDRLYLAAISTKPNIIIGSVNGLGLGWKPVVVQCGGRSATRTETWWAYGSPKSSGVVTANFLSTNFRSAVIAVVSYSGTSSFDNVISRNSKTIGDVTCSGGSDQKSYSLNVVNSSFSSLTFGAVALRQYKYTSANGFDVLTTINTNRGNGDDAGIAVVQKLNTSIGSQNLTGTFSSNNDYSVVGLEILPR